MKINKLPLFYIILFTGFSASGQNSFETSSWLTGYKTFYPQTGGVAQAGPDYGCALIKTRPLWFFIATCGTESKFLELNFLEYGINSNDYTDTSSLVMWGPFNDTINTLSKLTGANIVKCLDLYWGFSPWATLGIFLEPNKFYYSALMSSDSALKYYVNFWNSAPTNLNADSVNCSICNGYASSNEQQVCLVTVDSATQKNKIWWTPKDSSMQAYTIHRQTSILSQYDSIGRVENTQPSTFIDSFSNPLVKSYSYILGTIDSCGRQHSTFNYNTTMHLTTSAGINGEVNLVWNPYTGYEYWYQTFYIFRSLNSGAYEAIDSIASNTHTYTDLNPPVGELHYKIGILTPPCFTGNEKYTYSNRSSTFSVGVQHLEIPNGLMILPNPSNERTTLRFGSLSGKVKSVRMISAIGQNILCPLGAGNSEMIINTTGLAAGVYILEINTAATIYRLRLAVQH